MSRSKKSVIMLEYNIEDIIEINATKYEESEK